MVLSLALHLVVFWPEDTPHLAAIPVQALRVKLSSHEKEAALLAQAEPKPAATEEVTLKPPPPKPRRSPNEKVAMVSSSSRNEEAGSGDSSLPTIHETSLSIERQEDRDAPRGTASAEVATYRLALALAALSTVKDEFAMQDGVVVIEIHLIRGSYPALKVGRSSGIDDLDQKALRLMGYALKATPIPDGLTAEDNFSMQFPVVFTSRVSGPDQQ
ncbi:hypothetical protein [Zoogloea sp.]|uniref:hypothetical protein n=1 Tax=Zoogloea sp. TaxID=49181 RepID=UPI002613C8B9|nr:hypothetical protein [Zoogloea sp.]MDD3354733.1 hypothetical protein [Zoogloea sp.]